MSQTNQTSGRVSSEEKTGVLPSLHLCEGSRVDGNIVRIFGTKKAAQDGARAIGWPVGCVSKVHTRFQLCWALNLGIAGPGYLSRDRYGELHSARNGSAA